MRPQGSREDTSRSLGRARILSLPWQSTHTEEKNTELALYQGSISDSKGASVFKLLSLRHDLASYKVRDQKSHNLIIKKAHKDNSSRGKEYMLYVSTRP